jgi:hypothetical protein
MILCRKTVSPGSRPEGVGLSGLSRRSFDEGGSGASAKKMSVPRAAQALALRAGQSRGNAGIRGVLEQ